MPNYDLPRHNYVMVEKGLAFFVFIASVGCPIEIINNLQPAGTSALPATLPVYCLAKNTN